MKAKALLLILLVPWTLVAGCVIGAIARRYQLRVYLTSDPSRFSDSRPVSAAGHPENDSGSAVNLTGPSGAGVCSVPSQSLPRQGEAAS